MSKDFAIECDESNPYVQKHIRWYQQHPQHLHRVLKKSEPFIFYVYQQTHRNNLPAELALIPLLESQYNPKIGSRTGAAGLWQMMPGTASKFGIKITRSYDGRRDVPASTKAALTYLAYLHHYFNQDWLLALAAYDAGEGKVKYVARHNKNFWHLPLSKETKNYVPKLLAIAHIIKQHNEYNVALPKLETQLSSQTLTWNEAKTLGENSDRSDSGHSLESEVGPKMIKYKIRQGDTLAKIGKRFNLTTAELKKVNHIKNDKRLKIGKSLTIPN